MSVLTRKDWRRVAGAAVGAVVGVLLAVGFSLAGGHSVVVGAALGMGGPLVGIWYGGRESVTTITITTGYGWAPTDRGNRITIGAERFRIVRVLDRSTIQVRKVR